MAGGEAREPSRQTQAHMPFRQLGHAWVTWQRWDGSDAPFSPLEGFKHSCVNLLHRIETAVIALSNYNRKEDTVNNYVVTMVSCRDEGIVRP